jgi:hypothetical protein
MVPTVSESISQPQDSVLPFGVTRSHLHAGFHPLSVPHPEAPMLTRGATGRSS